MPPSHEQPVSDHPTPLSGAALARRQALLKGLGKGSAALAVASVPMRTLANTPTLFTLDGTRCSISGMQSGNHSRITTRATCLGKSPGYWHKYSHWIPSQRARWNVTFGSLFGDVTSPVAGFTLYDIVCSIGQVDGGGGKKGGSGGGAGQPPGPDNPVYSPNPAGIQFNNRPEWHWCCAWMNAMANNIDGTGVVDFPYTPSQVIAIYQNPSSFHGVTREQALEFFKKLEN